MTSLHPIKHSATIKSQNPAGCFPFPPPFKSDGYINVLMINYLLVINNYLAVIRNSFVMLTSSIFSVGCAKVAAHATQTDRSDVNTSYQA